MEFGLRNNSWKTHELAMTTLELAKKLNLAQPTISHSAMR